MRRFAAEHCRAHARLATVRPNAACACRAAECGFHEDTRASCTGAPLLVLIHNPAVGQVWTLAEICQACAPLISHTAVLGRAEQSAPPRSAAGSGSGSAPTSSLSAAPAPARAAVAGGFSSPEAAPEAVSRRRPYRGGPRRTR
ncbi:hypothetical protein [Streptomyces vinaceus]|uniref:hypothetical protein n=1 Tax=Streptomyces vinaceus TaxID=1960 RepID=UPI00380239E5